MERPADRLLRTEAQLDETLAGRGLVLLFKHSTACPISAAAFAEYHAFREHEGRDVAAAVIRVIEERAVSNRAAAALGVSHESPQALLAKDGNLVWTASHGAITRAALAEAVRQASAR